MKAFNFIATRYYLFTFRSLLVENSVWNLFLILGSNHSPLFCCKNPYIHTFCRLINKIDYHILLPKCLLRTSQRILTSLLNQVLPKILFSCLLDPPILRMDLWLTIVWANISRVCWVLGSLCLLDIVGTVPYTPLLKITMSVRISM